MRLSMLEFPYNLQTNHMVMAHTFECEKLQGIQIY